MMHEPLTVTAPRIPSQRIALFIQSFEKCAKWDPRTGLFKAYKPTPKDRWTCGWGTTGGVTSSTAWSADQCNARFYKELFEYGDGVTRLLQGAPTTQMQFDAMVSFGYNCGLDEDVDLIPEGLGDSTLLRKHRGGLYHLAAEEFPKWNTQAGKVYKGLTRRRALERLIYLGDEAGYVGNV